MKKILLLLSFFALVATVDAQSRKGKDNKTFQKKVAVLTRHPDEITLKAADSVIDYYFFITDQGLFFTERAEVWWEIQKHLPAEQIPGNKVELEGTPFRPFTKFPRKQLHQLSRRAGKVINKKTDAIRISGHSLITAATSSQMASKVIETYKNGQPVIEQ